MSVDGAVTGRLARVRLVVSRAAVTPMLVRAAIFAGALAALLVAYPAQVLATRLAGVLVLAAAWPAVRPRGRGATAVVLLAVGGWLVDTTFSGAAVALGRLLALAALLYLVHTLTALAAVLPYDAVVDARVVTGWLARAFGVILGSAVLTVLVLGAVRPAAGGGSPPVAVLGFAGAVLVAGLLTWLLRRS